MKITSVDIIDVANDFASATSKWRPVVVKINTDEGISGFGEVGLAGNDSNLLIVFYVQIMPDDFVMQLHRF